MIAQTDADSQEIARLRRELEEHKAQLQALQDEIEETNRGVVVLYAELEDQAELLRRSESKFQMIYAQAPSGIALLADDGGIIDGNPALSGLLAMPEGENLRGRRLSEFVPADFAPRVDAFCSTETVAPRAQEIPVQRHDGSLAYMEWLVSAQIEPGVTLVVATDVSQRVELEQRRVQWLERERVARGEAEQGSRQKDDFIAVLAHELRTPLNAIMGWAQVLRKRGGSDETVRGIVAIERNCTTQARMIADLLDMSRLNMGKLAMSFESIDPLKEIRAAVDAMEPAIGQKAIEVVITAAASYRPVRADSSRLQQVIWNLLSNAIKFSSHGGRVEVSLSEDDTGLRIRVADSGQGIRADFLPFVFDRFAQSDAAGDRHRGGLGLGLAIVKQIVDAHDGTISVHSDGPGHGSRFEVWLPIDRSAAAAVATVGPPGAADGAAAPDADHPMRGIRLLIVDDDQDAAAALRIILIDRGAHVVSADDADAALALIGIEPPDVLISDIGMPGRDGYELVREIRRLESGGLLAARGRRIPAIALTSFTRDEDQLQARNAGFDAHCAKPLKPIALVKEVLRLAGRTPRPS